METLFYDPKTDTAYRVKRYSAIAVYFTHVSTRTGRTPKGNIIFSIPPLEWISFRREFIPVRRAKDLKRIRKENNHNQ